MQDAAQHASAVWNVTTFGETIVAARKAVGMTQRELAERAGVSRRSLSDLETGLAQGLSLSAALRIAQAAGLAVSLGPADSNDLNLSDVMQKAQRQRLSRPKGPRP